MAIVKCPYCGQNTSDTAKFCRSCGASLSTKRKPDDPMRAISDRINHLLSPNKKNMSKDIGANTEKKMKSDSSDVLTMMILICAVMLILVGALASFRGSRGSFENKEETVYKISVPKSSSYFLNENYKDVQKILEGAGFTNIEFEVLDDLVTGWVTSDGAVEKVSIGGYTSFSTSDRFEPDSEIVITYHTFPMSESEKAAKESEESLQNISDETLEAIVGTYVGKNGSGLILYPDGKADYYWKDWDEAVSGNTWSYNDGVLAVFIPKMYGITADVKATANIGESNTSSFVLSSDSLNWDDEEYEKVSEKSVALSKSEYDKLIFGEDTSTEQQQNTEYECCGIVFEIPSYLKPDSSNQSDMDNFISEHCGLAFINGKADGLNRDQFEKKAGEATKSLLEESKQDSDDYTVTAESAITIAGQPAYLIEFEGTFSNTDMLGCVFLICNDGNLIGSIALFEEGAAGLSCKNDIYQMVEHARLADGTVGSSSIADSSPSDSMTMSQKNAVQAAQNYLSFMNFSRKGLIEQLSSPWGDGYSVADATFAVDYLEQNNLVNWNEQAKGSAESYLSFMTFSRQELYEQLTSEYGEGFTASQAEYALKALGY